MKGKNLSRRTMLMAAGATGLGVVATGTAAAQQHAGGREPSESRLETFRAPTRGGAGGDAKIQARGVGKEPSSSDLETSRASSRGEAEGDSAELLEVTPTGPVTGVVSRRFTFRENSNTPGRILEQAVAINVPPGSGFIVSMSYFTGAFTNSNFSRLAERPIGPFCFSVGRRGNSLVCQVGLTDSNSDDPVFIEVDANVLFFSQVPPKPGSGPSRRPGGVRVEGPGAGALVSSICLVMILAAYEP
ncbi:MAG: hypothetical protein WKF75_12085 [Singulisphaera sp.]